MGDQTSGGFVRVMLVDDQSSVRLIERVVLEREERIRVIAEATGGMEAVRIAAREQPDAILLDLDMPDVSGVEALPILLEVSPDSVVIVLSSLPEEEVASQVVALGARTYVQKQECMRDSSRLLAALPKPHD